MIMEHNTIFPKGKKITGDNFIGEVWQERLISVDSAWNCPMGNVTFSPSARNNWHSHPGGQILLIISGKGWYQEEGKAARSLEAGDVVMIPENVKHWHGATKDNWFTHIYIVTNPKKGSCQWFGPVTEKVYNQLL